MGKLIIDWSKTPVRMDRVNQLAKLFLQDLEGLSVAALEVFRETDEVKRFIKLLQKPAAPSTVSFNEHRMCCGTTCDREAVKRYIEHLETVADAAHHLEQSGVLAETPRMQNLKMALEDLKNE